jgi:hypothetical protein
VQKQRKFNHMKNILYAGLLTLLLTACSNQDKNDEPTGSPSDENGQYEKSAGSEDGLMKGHDPDSVHMEENHGNSDL